MAKFNIARHLFLIVVMIWLSGQQALAKETITIAAFGDSLIAGYGVAPNDAFPAQLEKKLLSDGYNVKVINDGVSGETSAGGMARVDYVLQQKPAVVILLLGGNDLLQGLPPENMKNNLSAIIEKLQQNHIHILLAGLKAPPAFGKKYVSNYDAVFPDLAAKYKLAYYPMFLDGVYGDQNLMQADGIHPGAKGVAQILEKMYPAILQILGPPH